MGGEVSVDTLTFFCIGTGHKRGEVWTLMPALFDLCDSFEVAPRLLVEASIGVDHVKVLIDGPETFLVSNQYLLDWCDNAVAFIERCQPRRLCLVGHSRGAVLATMIAAALRTRGSVKSTKVMLWLLDTVAVTDARGGITNVIGPARTLTVYDNVDQLVRVVMEDEGTEIAGQPAFPLEQLRIDLGDGRIVPDYEHRRGAGTRGPRITHIRMPGTHGTGTQVNTMTPNGSDVATEAPSGEQSGITTVRPGDVWPIGEACLIHALRALRDVDAVGPARRNAPNPNGVPLTDKGHQFAGTVHSAPPPVRTGDTLLAAYERILLHNRRTPTGAVKINDVSKDLLAPTPTQKYRFIRGRRSAGQLGPYGTDFTSGAGEPMIVNDDHRALISVVHGSDWAEAVETRSRTGQWPARPAPPEVDTTRAKLLALREAHDAQYVLLALAGATYDGQSVTHLTAEVGA